MKPDGGITIYDKFQPEGETISPQRSIMMAIAGFLFSKINHQLEPIGASVPDLTRDAIDLRFSAYRVVILTKAS